MQGGGEGGGDSCDSDFVCELSNRQGGETRERWKWDDDGEDEEGEELIEGRDPPPLAFQTEIHLGGWGGLLRGRWHFSSGAGHHAQQGKLSFFNAAPQRLASGLCTFHFI